MFNLFFIIHINSIKLKSQRLNDPRPFKSPDYRPILKKKKKLKIGESKTKIIGQGNGF